MTTFARTFTIASGLALLAGCSNSNPSHRGETPGEQVGRAAYDAQKDIKKGAKEVTKDLKQFRHDAQAGYQEEKQRQQAKPDERRSEPPNH